MRANVSEQIAPSCMLKTLSALRYLTFCSVIAVTLVRYANPRLLFFHVPAETEHLLNAPLRWLCDI